MNRSTSHYRLTVEVPGADHETREQALQHLIGRLPEEIPLAGSAHKEGQVEIAYRCADDLVAISIAQGCLLEAFARHAASIHTGFGVHRRHVAEQVAR